MPVGKAARTKVRLQISVVVSIAWLLLGMAVLAPIEDWSHLDALYFCVITLSTVGLGDFVPKTSAGMKFAFFYCMVRDIPIFKRMHVWELFCLELAPFAAKLPH